MYAVPTLRLEHKPRPLPQKRVRILPRNWAPTKSHLRYLSFQNQGAADRLMLESQRRSSGPPPPSPRVPSGFVTAPLPGFAGGSRGLLQEFRRTSEELAIPSLRRSSSASAGTSNPRRTSQSPGHEDYSLRGSSLWTKSKRARRTLASSASSAASSSPGGDGEKKEKSLGRRNPDKMKDHQQR